MGEEQARELGAGITGNARDGRRCLHDEAFASALIAEQRLVAERATDLGGWWAQLLAGYDLWRSGAAAPVA